MVGRHAGGVHTAFDLKLIRTLEEHIGVGNTVNTVVPRYKAESLKWKAHLFLPKR